MKRSFVVVIITIVAFSVLSYPAFGAERGDSPEPEKIVLVADISGSIVEYDAGYSMKDALSLAAGLAPDGVEMALLSVNTDIQTETEFYDTSSAEGRRLLRTAADGLAYQGNTDLVAGLERAVERLDYGPGRIILIADISEGGLTPADTARASVQTALAEELAARCVSSGITVDLLLMGQAPEENALADAIEGFADKTGGRILRAESGSALSQCVEDLYFSSYTYLMWPVTGSVTQSQTISLSMPTNGINRARVYAPGLDVKAAYAGAGLETESRPAFTLLDLSRPAREGISLTADPDGGNAEIYLITDYDLEAAVTAASEIVVPEKKGGEATQSTTLTIDVLDKATGGSILDEAAAPLFIPEVTLTSPEGEILSLQAEAAGGTYIAAFYPDSYGTYDVSVTLTQGENTLPAARTTFDAEDIRPVKTAWNLSLIAAVIIGILLILSAIIYAAAKKRRGSGLRVAMQPEEKTRFSGRLQVATVIAGGGTKEIPPFSFHLDKAGNEKKLSLGDLYEASAVSCPYANCSGIFFLPGPGESIILKNNSNAKILYLGKSYGPREKIQLYYNEKVYIIFEEHEDELEIYYRAARDASSTRKRLSFSMQD